MYSMGLETSDLPMLFDEFRREQFKCADPGSTAPLWDLARWRLASDVTDTVGKYTGQLVGSGASFADKSLVLSGNDGFARIPASECLDALRHAFTVALWLKPRGAASLQAVFSQGNQLVVTMQATEVAVRVATTQGAVRLAGVIKPQAWTHLAVTYDGEHVMLWINGVRQASGELTGVLAATEAPINLGADADGQAWFAGALRDVAVFRSALDAEAISELLRPPTCEQTNTFYDIESDSCKSVTPCPAGTYVAEASTPTKDQSCAQCDGVTGYSDVPNLPACKAITKCVANAAYTVAPTPTSDGSCACQAGFYQAADASCQPVSPPCTLPAFQQAAPST